MTKKEAEAVTDIGTAFQANKNITDFSALEYFTSLTSIPYRAFYGCTSLSAIKIPQSVVSLGAQCFWQNVYTSFKIPSHIKTIGSAIFAYCPVLQYVDISEINNSTTGGIFNYLTGLKSVDLPPQITTIADMEFNSCAALASLHIPSTVTKVGNRVLFNTKGSVKSITVDASNAFYDSRNDCNAIIHTATNNLICGCANTIVPDGVVKIETGALQNVGLATFSLPESVTTIGNYCFDGGTFTEAIIPDSVIGTINQLFYQCSKLEEVVIGSGVSNLGNYSLSGCPKLKKLILKYPEGIVDANTSNTLTSAPADLVIYVPSNLVGDYKAHALWGKYTIEAIPS